MKRTKRFPGTKYTLLVPFAVMLFSLVFESCNSERKCGCKGDLSGNYRSKRHRNW